MYGAETPKQSLSERILSYFPERQIYLRSDGNVRFVRFSTNAQLIIASTAIAVLGWFAFSSIHFLTRDLVLEAREDTILEMAAEYDRLSDDMGTLQSDVVEQTDRLEMRQKYLNALMVEEPLGEFEEAAPAFEILSPVDGGVNASGQTRQTPGQVTSGSAEEKTSMAPVAPVGSAEDRRFFAALIPSAHAAALGTVQPADQFRLEMLIRLGRVETEQTALAGQLINHARNRLAALDLAIETTGLASADLIAYWKGPVQGTAAGGPFIPDPTSLGSLGLGSEPASGSAADMLVQLDAEWNRLLKAYDAVGSIPAATPADDFYVSSRYGKRTDPIRKVRAMHYAVDLAGWPGNKILSGASGIVTKAGTWGSYGNMIEIDHGNGFKTRYGHLRRIEVKRGEVLDAGQPIGEMGCSGRCTSTHLHYEVWFAGKPRNPLPFLKVSENVFEIQQRREFSGNAK